MKYGNFVGKEWLEITTTEKDNFHTYVENLINKNNLPFNISECYVENYSIYKGPKINNAVIVKLNWTEHNHLHNVRNHNKDLISVDGPITFMFYKSSGYLDETDWLNMPFGVSKEEITKFLKYNYEDAPAFQYSCHTISGIHYRKFRHRTWGSLGSVDYFGKRISPYFYGTEFNDMEDEMATYLKALINFIK